jgi:thiamine-monophosphate kinase
VGDVGEFELIDRLVARLGPARSDTIVGAGPDDTCVLRLGDGTLQLATIDSQIEGIHFHTEHFSPEDVGRKAAAVNLSDIAAMGGTPTHALAALSAPLELSADFALRVVDGLSMELSRWGADLVGGNLSRGERVVLDMTLLGEVDQERLLLRSGARPGDAVLVTGHLGAAAAGMALMMARHDPSGLPPEHRQTVLARQRWPEPRLEIGPLLGARGATAAIDLSDGLASDVRHICRASGVGVRIEASQIPVAPATLAVAEALELNATELALGGGEDYELLFTAPPEKIGKIVDSVASITRVPVTRIGCVTAVSSIALVRDDGAEQPLVGGWQHFAAGSRAGGELLG